MSRATELNTKSQELEVLITRVFDSPRELVFETWSDSKHLVQWYAPSGCTLQFLKFDFRPGGTFVSRLRNSASGDCLCKGTYLEIIVPERIVHTLSFSDENGRTVDPADAGKDPDWPRETIVTVTFTERQGKTMLTLHQTVPESIAKRTGAYHGWVEMLDRLSEKLTPAA